MRIIVKFKPQTGLRNFLVKITTPQDRRTTKILLVSSMIPIPSKYGCKLGKTGNSCLKNDVKIAQINPTIQDSNPQVLRHDMQTVKKSWTL